MKTVTIYFKADMGENEKAHQVNEEMLYVWMNCYKESGTPFPCVLATDEKTTIPSFWKEEVIRCSTEQDFVFTLQKSGWIKSQIHSLCGDCLVLDLDAFCMKNIKELEEIDSPLAMVPDIHDGIWNEHWPEVGRKHNSGVMVIKSPLLKRFTQIWEEKKDFLKTTPYYDECIFTQILNETGGLSLERCYNNWNETDDIKILHFCSKEKKQEMQEFLNGRLSFFT